MKNNDQRKAKLHHGIRLIGIAGLAMVTAGAGMLSGCSGSKLKPGKGVDGDDFVIAEPGFRSAFVMTFDSYASVDAQRTANP